ncbi:MAG: hypothetical protein HQK76_08005 [Desulfobacterales bacterium]|nr:hypothetical protein [Desulfobacterales bacterium]
METTALTKQDIIDFIMLQSKEFLDLLKQERLEREKSRKEFEEKLEKERLEREKENEKRERENERRIKALDKAISDVSGTLGRFVEGMVRPRIVKLFQRKGIAIRALFNNVCGYKANDEKDYEIDMFLTNDKYAIAVEVKTTLGVKEVNEHLERLKRIQKNSPKPFRLTDMILLGAVVGMSVHEDADKYAYRKGLYVLKQKGNIVTIVNDNKFVAKEWIIH